MAFGAIVIGDEILVGKRQDKHLSFAIEALAKRGLRLAWAEYHGDDPQRLTAALRRSFDCGQDMPTRSWPPLRPDAPHPMRRASMSTVL